MSRQTLYKLNYLSFENHKNLIEYTVGLRYFLCNLTEQNSPLVRRETGCINYKPLSLLLGLNKHTPCCAAREEERPKNMCETQMVPDTTVLELFQGLKV